MEAKQAAGLQACSDEPATATCRHCSEVFIARPWQIKSKYFECPACKKVKTAEWRARRKAEGRPVIPTPMPAEYHRAYAAVYFQNPANRERRNAHMRAYANAEERAERKKARSLTRHAIDAGRLVRQPCEVCGEAKVQAHHDDYAKPLDVRWLCLKHHYEHHNKAIEHKGE